MYLLDTHAFVWSLTGDKRLSASALAVIKNRSNLIFVSSISFYELALKHHLGKWPEAAAVIQNQQQLMTQMQFKELGLSVEHALASAALPLSHRDPFDRLLAAQAQCEAYQLISKDMALSKLGVNLLW